MTMKHEPYGPYEKYFKRPIDFVCGLAAVIVFCWLYVIVAVLVRVKLGSPVLFTQDRPGKDEKIFKLYKFRTMTDEGGIPVFIDTETDTWNMDPVALEKAFEIYPEVKLVVMAHLYGTPGKNDELKAISDKCGAIIIEDAAESLGATYKGVQTGSFGKYNCISFNGNKIITGSAGGMLLTDSLEAANKVRKWSTQARENAAWYQHEELGYNYRMSNVIAGVVRGQYPHLEEHIAQKKAIYERYKEGLKNLSVKMNPYDDQNSEPNFWLSCLIIDENAMCKQVRGEKDVCYVKEAGKSLSYRDPGSDCIYQC